MIRTQNSPESLKLKTPQKCHICGADLKPGEVVPFQKIDKLLVFFCPGPHQIQETSKMIEQRVHERFLLAKAAVDTEFPDAKNYDGYYFLVNEYFHQLYGEQFQKVM